MSEADMTDAIRVEGVSKDFKLPHEKVSSVKSFFVNPLRSRRGLKTETQHALRDISFEVKKGEFFGVVGRNGSGKSTLLKILAGIYQPTKGKVVVNGRLVPFIELGVGFNPELSGRENVYLNGALMGFSTKEVDGKYREIVAFAELERFMDQKLKNYSSGMQVRLAFSVATILADSDILLVDEVLAVGDADFQRKCFAYFKKLKRQKKTVIFVSHDMDAVREYCNRAILIEDSRIIYSGKASMVAMEYKRLFLGEEEGEEDQPPVEDRTHWGNKKVSFEKVSLDTKHVTDDNKTITISMRVKAREDVEAGTLIGFHVKTPDGQPMIATNTKLQEVSIEAMKKGEKKKLDFTFPNVLSEGDYTVTVAIEAAAAAETYDWWEDALTIHSRRVRPTPALLHMDMKTNLSDG